MTCRFIAMPPGARHVSSQRIVRNARPPTLRLAPKQKARPPRQTELQSPRERVVSCPILCLLPDAGRPADRGLRWRPVDRGGLRGWRERARNRADEGGGRLWPRKNDRRLPPAGLAVVAAAAREGRCRGSDDT